MKALPLWQPWASLIAMGAKRVETRDYPPSRLGLVHGQRLAIYATKTLGDGGLAGFWEAVEDEHIAHALEEDLGDVLQTPEDLPRGAVVATCTLVRASCMTDESIDTLAERNPAEHAFGKYAPGRWAWVLTDLERLDPPRPARGSQGTFDWHPGDAVPVPAQGTLL